MDSKEKNISKQESLEEKGKDEIVTFIFINFRLTKWKKV